MKSPTVKELEPKQQVTALFLVNYKDIRQKKTGEPYLSMVLADRTGEIDAKMWDNVADVMDSFGRDDFIRVKGETLLFQNRLQLNVHRLAKVADSEIELSDFLPASTRDPDEMFAELNGVIAGFGNAHLKALLELIFSDPGLAAAFRRAPAAKTIHHAWLGGLLEHVLSLARLARLTAAHYPHVDADLLLAGVILHDIGKVRELSYERSFAYSTEGQLIGHIVMGLQIVESAIARLPDFPPKLRLLLQHMLLSHHGQLEFGSPKVPLFAEALLLHHLDNMDSKMEAMRATLDRDRPVMEGEWSNYSQALERAVLDKDKFLAPPRPAPAPPAPAPRGTVFGSQLADALKGDK